MEKPGIVTAVPVSRYSFGGFTLTVLDEIESNDNRQYYFIMAVIQGDNPEPGMYLTAEQEPVGTCMRIIMQDGSEVVGHSDDWSRRDAFIEEAISVTSRVLGLSDETPYQLM